MELRDDTKANKILMTVSEVMSSPDGLANDQPTVLSCGGIYLRGRKVPKSLSSWKMSLFLPNSNIRVYRMRGESTRQSFRRILAGESLN